MVSFPPLLLSRTYPDQKDPLLLFQTVLVHLVAGYDQFQQIPYQEQTYRKQKFELLWSLPFHSLNKRLPGYWAIFSKHGYLINIKLLYSRQQWDDHYFWNQTVFFSPLITYEPWIKTPFQTVGGTLLKTLIIWVFFHNCYSLFETDDTIS